MGSATSLLYFAPHRFSGLTRDGFSYLLPYGLGRAFPTARLAYPPVSPRPPNGKIVASDSQPIVHRLRFFGLGLGPGLLWADEPSPENLRFSAGRILTCLFAYLYRHSHFSPVHSSLRYCFNPMRTLPYQFSRQSSGSSRQSSGSSRQDLYVSRNR